MLINDEFIIEQIQVIHADIKVGILELHIQMQVAGIII